MKFIFSRDLRDQPHIRLALIFFVIALLAFWALNWPYESYTFGLSPAQIQLHVLGDAEAFAPAMGFDTLLLNIHVRLFLYTIALLTVASIYFRLPVKQKMQITMVSLTYSLVLLNMLGIIALRYISPQFVWLKCLSFWGFQLVFGWMLIHSIWFLLTPKRKPQPHVAH